MKLFVVIYISNLVWGVLGPYDEKDLSGHECEQAVQRINDVETETAPQDRVRWACERHWAAPKEYWR